MFFSLGLKEDWSNGNSRKDAKELLHTAVPLCDGIAVFENAYLRLYASILTILIIDRVRTNTIGYFEELLDGKKPKFEGEGIVRSINFYS